MLFGVVIRVQYAGSGTEFLKQNPLRMLSLYRMLLSQELCTTQFRFTKDWLLAVRCVCGTDKRWRKNGKRMPHYSLNVRMGLEALAASSTIFLLTRPYFLSVVSLLQLHFSFHVFCSSFLFIPLCFL